MSYEDRENSAHDGAPIELFQFVRGNVTKRYTSLGADVIALGETWFAERISHTEIMQSRELARDGVTITFPLGNEFARSYATQLVEESTSVTIWRGHAGEAEWRVWWKGRVANGEAGSGGTVALKCESVAVSSRRMGLRRRYTRNCGYALYHRGCNLDRADWAVPALCTAVAGNTVTVPAAAAADQPEDWYLGGMVEFDGALRFVVDQSGPVLTLMRPFEGLAGALANSGYGLNYGNHYGGVAVVIYPGCDRTKETCADKFNNTPNNGSFWTLPRRNPWDGSSIL